MSDFVNKLYRNHSLIYKGLLFVCTTFLIVYLFPKSGKFKYNFEKGKPWQSEVLLAPFDFAIKKTDAELTVEKQELSDNSFLYFDLDGTVKSRILQAYAPQFRKTFSDSISRAAYNSLFKVGQEIICGEYLDNNLTNFFIMYSDLVRLYNPKFENII